MGGGDSWSLFPSLFSPKPDFAPMWGKEVLVYHWKTPSPFPAVGLGGNQINVKP